MEGAEAPGNAFAQELAEAVESRALPHRRALLVGILNKHLPEGSRAVLVGGGLLEILTKGAYTTGDVDLVGDRDRIADLLQAAGFDRQGRHFVHPELGLNVEIPGRRLDPSQRSETVEFEGYAFPALSVEDLLVDRLCAAKFWRSTTDWEQAILLYATHRDLLDPGYLRDRAAEERVEDVLRELREAVEEE